MGKRGVLGRNLPGVRFSVGSGGIRNGTKYGVFGSAIILSSRSVSSVAVGPTTAAVVTYPSVRVRSTVLGTVKGIGNIGTNRSRGRVLLISTSNGILVILSGGWLSEGRRMRMSLSYNIRCQCLYFLWNRGEYKDSFLQPK